MKHRALRQTFLVLVALALSWAHRATAQDPLPLTPEQARQAAAARIQTQIGAGLAPGWIDAELGEPITLYDLTGTPSAYLLPVVSQAEPSGYLTVAAAPIPNPVLEFATEGAAPLSGDLSLAKDWERDLGAQLLVDRPLYLGLLGYTYELSITGPVRQILHLPTGRVLDVDSTAPLEPLVRTVRSSTPASSNSAPAAFRLISGVPDWNQYIGSYGCYSGCSPTSAANVVGYWNRHGFGTLVYGDDWEGAVDEMRFYMGTYCSDGGGGATPISSISPGIVDYASAHDYRIESELWCASSGCSTAPTYANYRAEIDAGRPVVVDILYHDSYGNHTVAGVGYDTSGTFMIVHDNWPSTPEDVWLQHGSGYGSIWMHPVAPRDAPGRWFYAADGVRIVDMAYNTLRSEYLVAWSEIGSSGYAYLHVQVFNRLGQPAFAAWELGRRNQSATRVIYNPFQDEYLLAWDRTYFGLDVQRLSRQGAPLGSSVAVIDSVGASGGALDIALDTRRNQYLVLFNAVLSDWWAAGAQRVAANGSLIGDYVWIAGDFFLGGDVAYNHQDDVYLVVGQWAGAGSEDWDIHGRFVGPDGSHIGSLFRIERDANAQDYPFVEWNPDRREYLVIWKDDFQGNGTPDVYGRRLDASGIPFGAYLPVASDNQTGKQPTGLERKTADGSYLAAWTAGFGRPYVRALGPSANLSLPAKRLLSTSVDTVVASDGHGNHYAVGMELEGEVWIRFAHAPARAHLPLVARRASPASTPAPTVPTAAVPAWKAPP